MANIVEYLAFLIMMAGCLIAAAAASLLAPHQHGSSGRLGQHTSVAQRSLSAIHSLNYIIMLIWIAFAAGIFGIAAGAVIGLFAMLLITPSFVHNWLADLAHRFDRETLARNSILAAAFMLAITLAVLVWPNIAGTLNG